MLRYALKESGRWALALLGALLIAVAVSALSASRGGYGAALAGRLLDFLRFDFGRSAISGLSAAEELTARGRTTFDIVAFGTLIALALGVPLGLLLGTRSLRRATAPLIQTVSAAPVFCAGLALAWAGYQLGFRAAGAEGLQALVLPAVTVGLAGTAAVQMVLRRKAAEAQDSPFRLGLRRLGLSGAEIERVYVAPLVFAGLLESLGEVMLALLSAAVVSEWVFQCRGIADLFVKSVALHDWNMAALILFVFAAVASTAEFLGRIGANMLARAAA
jgi:ABC-type dipeptide/oligopeptide/nickel transport system permease component